MARTVWRSSARYCPACIAVMGLTAAACLIARGAPTSRLTTHPATRSTSRPATAPAVWPTPTLIHDTQAAAEALRGRLDESFVVLAAPPFVVAGNLPAQKLRGYLTASIERPARAMWKAYFRRRPDKVITVLLLADSKSYRTWARKLFGDSRVPYFGYYRHADRTLVMNIHTGTGTLVHELTHALIETDWPDAPLWFNEGLASLHEQCRVGDDGITGLTNWRLEGLQEEIRAGRLRSIADLVARNDFYGPGQGVNYAHARYLGLYLQRQGLLEEFYHAYRKAHGEGKPALPIIERLCQKPVAEIDKAFAEWVLTLRWP